MFSGLLLNTGSAYKKKSAAMRSGDIVGQSIGPYLSIYYFLSKLVLDFIFFVTHTIEM